MGLFGFGPGRDRTGEKAYRLHAQANKLSDRGRAIDAENSYMQAKLLYERAEKEGMSSPKLLTGYSVLLMRYGDFEKAKEIINGIYSSAALTAEDRYYLALNHALCQYRLGEAEKALNDIALTGEHKHNQIYFDVVCPILIEEGTKNGDFSKAEKLCAEAMEYDDEDASILCSCAYLEYRRGNIEKAMELSRKAVNVNPNSPGAKVLIGRISAENGDNETAKKYLNSALKVHFPTTCPFSKEYAEELLASLES